jgi:hypothetical protein
MAKQIRATGSIWCAGLTLAAVAMFFPLPERAQSDLPDAPQMTRVVKGHALTERLPDKPSLPPSFSYPIDPMGFTPPGALYLGQRSSLVSLDFLDESHLLFTFRVPGLIHREPGDSEWGEERQIRAVVVALPAGAVEAEALWTVHDRGRYLWMLNDGHFLLRDRDSLQLGDASLVLKPYLRFPGALLNLETDPTQQYLVTDSREQSKPKPGEASTPSAASASISVDGQSSSSDQMLRILRRDTGQVMLVSHVRSAVHLPINADGYIESLRGRGLDWLLNLKYFSGGSKIVGRIDSACAPTFDFLSQREVLATACNSTGAERMVALTIEGRRLWEAQASNSVVWPLLTRSPDGLRMAREVLAVSHEITDRAPLDREDIKGQLVEIFNAADGQLVLETTASPILDAGGNVAISPSSRHVAVLNAAAIQIFDLPAPPPLPPANPPLP